MKATRKAVLISCFVALVARIAAAWPVHVTHAGLNHDSSSVVVIACHNKDELTLLCDVNADDCIVVSVGEHDLKGIADTDKKTKYPGQNVVIDDAHVFQLHSTDEKSYACEQR